MALSPEAKRARAVFRDRWSSESARIIQRIARGETSQEVADKLNVPRTTVTTTRGNLTRDVYFPYAYTDTTDGEVLGVCQF